MMGIQSNMTDNMQVHHTHLRVHTPSGTHTLAFPGKEPARWSWFFWPCLLRGIWVSHRCLPSGPRRRWLQVIVSSHVLPIPTSVMSVVLIDGRPHLTRSTAGAERDRAHGDGYETSLGVFGRRRRPGFVLEKGRVQPLCKSCVFSSSGDLVGRNDNH